jgi:hypothetical protein
VPVALQPFTHSFGESIAVDEVENLVGQTPRHADDSRSLSLDLSTVRHVQPGAGYRLGNALARWGRGEIIVEVPDPRGFSGGWFQTFTRSGIGLAIARHATQVRCGSLDITAQVRAYYTKTGSISSTNYAVCIDIEDGGLPADIDAFATLLLDLASYVGLDAITMTPDARRFLVTLVSEAAQNIVDHAYKEPWEFRETTLSFLSLRHYESMSAKDGPSGLAGYLTRAREMIASEGVDLLGWTEIIVCDDGVGIAARQAGSPELADGPLEVERDALEQALLAGESVKLRTRDAVIIGEPGFGFTLISDALVDLKGHVAVRSGRLLAQFDGTAQDSAGFVLSDATLGWLPGTALHIVLPVRDPQLRMPGT